MSKKIKCEKCKNNSSDPKDMENNASNVLLCDDCYTELRYLIADYLSINVQEINV